MALFHSLNNLLKKTVSTVAKTAKSTSSGKEERVLPGMMKDLNKGLENIASGSKTSGKSVGSSVAQGAAEAARRAEAARCAALQVKVEDAYETLRRAETLASQARDMKSRITPLVSTAEQAWQGDSGARMRDALNNWVKIQENDVASMELKIQSMRKAVDQLVAADKGLSEYMRSH